MIKHKKPFNAARSEERQQGIAHICLAGPRVVMEFALELASGKPLDVTLARYCRIPVLTYRMMGAGTLPAHAKFEDLWRRRGAR